MRLTSQRSPKLLVALAVLLSSCSAVDEAGGVRTAEATTQPAETLFAVRADGVEPCTQLPRREPGDAVSGTRLPRLVLPCLTGGSGVDVARLGGDRPVLLNLWATWCGPCREEMPILQEGHVRYGDEVSFVGVNTKDSPPRAGNLLETVGVTYPQLVDVDGRLLAELGIPGLPVTLVLNDRGTVVRRHVGPVTKMMLADFVETVRRPAS